MASSDDFVCWISDLAAGDSIAAQRVWQEYFEKLVRFARRKLDNLPRRVADEEDVALSALKSFVRGVERGRFPQLTDRDDLWRILATITARKAIAEHRRHAAVKRGGGAVRGESAFLDNDEIKNGGIGGVLGSAPTPEFQALMTEQCANMLELLNDDTLRQVALYKLEGFSNQEISDALGRTTRQVERWLARIRDKWGRET